MSRVSYYDTHPQPMWSLVPHKMYKERYTFDDAYNFVWRHTRPGFRDEFVVAIYSFNESLHNASHLDDKRKFELLYKFAIDELDSYSCGTEQRDLLILVVCGLEYMTACNERKPHNPEHYPTDYRHGRKRSAHRWKVDHDDEWNKWADWKCRTISKCWKDQSRRRHQWKPVD